jgi:hypothetical protein
MYIAFVLRKKLGQRVSCLLLALHVVQIQDTFSKTFALYFIILPNQFTLNQFTSVVMRDVPAQICTTCGEEYVDAAIRRRFLAMTSRSSPLLFGSEGSLETRQPVVHLAEGALPTRLIPVERTRSGQRWRMLLASLLAKAIVLLVLLIGIISDGTTFCSALISRVLVATPLQPVLCRLIDDMQSRPASRCLAFFKITFSLSHLIRHVSKTDDLVLL